MRVPGQDNQKIPHHVVIIMDGNGRWARKRNRPRAAGHRAGVNTLRKIVEHAASREIQALTVYAFSSENWRRPGKEVSVLLKLFVTSLQREVRNLNENQVRLQFIGDRERFPEKLQQSIKKAEALTATNTGLRLIVAANYGGRWDITNACRQLGGLIESGKLTPAQIDEELMQSHLSLSELPEPDLFIRTGGEKRLSNYLLWQIAYTELYFTDCLWPDFNPDHFDTALAWFSERQRRFGQTSEQIKQG
ncbi:MAG: di-trans,poly-cis-decaprenylcistransferase [Gammaproteobacteria bacterium RBG_16_51_14]|nr:MAG: di-trans,poly-cis-decaprenylcistransferase [Gammaproteobacteria bacterium RBG_16_51_14]